MAANPNKPTQPKIIISLAPHWTEIIYAIQAANSKTSLLVGVSKYSDYPLAAKQLPQVGDAFQLDFERIAMLKPDIIVYWPSATPKPTLKKLANPSVQLYGQEIQSLSDLFLQIKQLGQILEQPQAALQLNTQLQTRVRRIQQKTNLIQRHKPIKVFYQVWDKPLMTINHKHLINDLISKCGAKNIFAPHKTLTPLVDIESLALANPDVLITSAVLSPPALPIVGKDALPYFATLKTVLPQLKAFQTHQLIVMNADTFTRATPRTIDAYEQLCQTLSGVK